MMLKDKHKSLSRALRGGTQITSENVSAVAIEVWTLSFISEMEQTSSVVVQLELAHHLWEF